MIKAIEDKPEEKTISQYLQRYLIILLKKEKNIMSEFHGDINIDKLYFKYEGPTKDINLINMMIPKNFLRELKSRYQIL